MTKEFPNDSMTKWLRNAASCLGRAPVPLTDFGARRESLLLARIFLR
jgi:hypothetical protein